MKIQKKKCCFFHGKGKASGNLQYRSISKWKDIPSIRIQTSGGRKCVKQIYMLHLIALITCHDVHVLQSIDLINRYFVFSGEQTMHYWTIIDINCARPVQSRIKPTYTKTGQWSFLQTFTCSTVLAALIIQWKHLPWVQLPVTTGWRNIFSSFKSTLAQTRQNLSCLCVHSEHWNLCTR